jgi:hypothetical protein
MTSSKIGMSMFAGRWLPLGTSGIVGLALAVVFASGCNTPPSAVAAPGSGVADTAQSASGALSVAVVVPPNLQIDTIDYQLTNTGFNQAGSLNVSQGATISGVIGGIPAGPGYTLTLTTTDVAKTFTSCAGSSTVAVTGGATTPVSVAIECRLPAVPPPPAVPIPMPAVVFLAVVLLAVGARSTRRSGPL